MPRTKTLGEGSSSLFAGELSGELFFIRYFSLPLIPELEHYIHAGNLRGDFFKHLQIMLQRSDVCAVLLNFKFCHFHELKF